MTALPIITKGHNFIKKKKKQEAHGPHRSPELTAVNMYM